MGELRGLWKSSFFGLSVEVICCVILSGGEKMIRTAFLFHLFLHVVLNQVSR